jgi:hypothetical protein
MAFASASSLAGSASRCVAGTGRLRGRQYPVSTKRAAEWHHHLVNEVDIGLIIARTRRSTAVILASSALSCRPQALSALAISAREVIPSLGKARYRCELTVRWDR